MRGTVSSGRKQKAGGGNQVFYRTGMGGGAGYAMCNCCVDGCLPLMNRRACRNYRFIRGTQVAQVDADCCTACGACAEVCAFGARETDGALDTRHCYGCGLCADTCPVGAVAMVARKR
jgi:MinD superfamily P-loop ATPase